MRRSLGLMRTTSQRNRVVSRGLSKAVALLMLFPLALVEFVLTVLMLVYGMRGIGLIPFLGWIAIMGPIIGLTVYILFYDRDAQQNQGYMEVSNYTNLNRIGKS